MFPYTVIKEANAPQYSGTATGVINFLNFTFSALLGPVFGRIFQSMSGGLANCRCNTTRQRSNRFFMESR